MNHFSACRSGWLSGALTVWLAGHCACAGTVSPEARSLLESLRKKLRDVETLSWEVEQRPNNFYQGYYKKGGLVKICRRFGQLAIGSDDLFTPTEFSRLDRAEDHITRNGPVSPDRLIEDLWVILPLLHEDTLRLLGSVSLKPPTQGDPGERTLVLETFLADGRRDGALHFAFAAEGLFLRRVVATCGYGRILKVEKYQKVGDYHFPALARITVPAIDYEATYEITRIRVNADLADEVFSLRQDNTLVRYAGQTFGEVKGRLGADLEPQEAASLHYTLGFLLADLCAPQEAVAEYRRASELCPKATAPHFALVHGFERHHRWDEAAAVLEAMLAVFPDRRDLVYERLSYLSNREHFDRSDPGLSLKWARAWTAARPESPRAWSHLAGMLKQKGHLEGAEQAYHRTAQLPGASGLQQASARLGLAEVYEKLERHEDAESILRAILKDKGSGPSWPGRQAIRALYRVWWAMGRLDAALTEALKMHEQSPTDTDVLRRLVVAYSVSGQIGKAAEFAERLIDIRPQEFARYEENIFAHPGLVRQRIRIYEKLVKGEEWAKRGHLWNLLRLYRQTGEKEKTNHLAEELTKSESPDLYLLGGLANHYEQCQEVEKALPLYRKALAVVEEPLAKEGWRLVLARAYQKAGRPDEAREIARDLAANGQQDYMLEQAIHLLAGIMRERAEVDAYVAGLRAEIGRAPASARTVRQLARFLSARGRYAEVADLERRLTQLEPGNVQNYVRWTSALDASRQYQDLLAAWKLFFDKFPEQRHRYFRNLVAAYQNAGQLDQAIEEVSAFSREFPSNTHVIAELARTLQDAGRLDRVIALYQKLLKTGKHFGSLFSWRQSLIRIHVERDQLKEARLLAQELVRDARRSHYRQQAYRQLVGILRQTGELAAWMKALEEKAAAGPRDAALVRELACAWYARGDYARSADYLRELVALEPSKESFSEWLTALQEARKPEDLVKAYGQCFEAFPEERRNGLPRLVSACRDAGKADEAIRASRECIEVERWSANAYSQHAEILRHFKKYDEAIEAYRKAIELAGGRSGGSDPWRWRADIASIYQSQGKLKEAEDAARAVVAEAPHSGYARNAVRVLDSVLKASGREAESIRELDKRAAENPQDKAALRQLIAIYNLQNRHEDLPDIYRKLIALEPTRRNYEARCSSLSNAQRYVEAMAAYQDFFARFPASKRGHFSHFLDACKSAGKVDQAIEAAQEYVKAGPGDGEALGHLASAYAYAGKLDEAAATYQQAAEEARYPSDRRDWQLCVAEIHRYQGKTAAAEKLSQSPVETAEPEKLSQSPVETAEPEKLWRSPVRTVGRSGQPDRVRELRRDLQNRPWEGK